MQKFCEKTRKFSEKNKDENCGAKKMRNFAKKNTEIINYDIIKLLMLSFRAENSTSCFAQLIIGAIFAKYCIVFAFFRLIHFCEKM